LRADEFIYSLTSYLNGAKNREVLSMSKKVKNFIDRRVFDDTISNVPRRDGKQYEDINTIYGDMSRLVVAWLADTPPKKLQSLYNELGWGGNCNVIAIHHSAKAWFDEHHPGRLSNVAEGGQAND
jgi:hypothetical protein